MNFRTDKALIRETNHWCELERASWKPAHSSKKYTPEQRLALAHQYLDKHAFLTVSIYRQLTGLVRSTATVELRKWAHTPGSGIDTSGIGSHKVYVKRKEASSLEVSIIIGIFASPNGFYTMKKLKNT